MNTLDISIVIIWLFVILGLGIWAGIGATLEGFWVNKRATGTAFLVFTVVATQVGGGTIIGISSSTYSAGTGFGVVAIISTVLGFIAVAWLAPWAKRFGDKNKAYTLPEVFRKRYGRGAQLVAALLILFAYISLLGGQFLSVAVLLQVWTGIGLHVALLLAAGGVIVYSAFAGLRGDIVTDAIHFWIMALILFLILFPVTGIDESLTQALANVEPKIWSPLTFGGWVYLIAGILFGFLIPIVSMEMWMRVYAANDEKVARRAFIWSAIAVIPFYVVPLFLGLVATQLKVPVTRPDSLLVELLFRYLPQGMLGLAVAGMLSVIISTANTMILVLGAVLYRDFLGREGVNEGQEVKVSRLITFFMGVLGVIFAVFTPSIVQLILNAFFIILVMGAALIGVTWWKGATSKGAVASLIGGGLGTISCLNIMPQQAFIPGLLLSCILFFSVSLFTKHSPHEDLTL